MAISPNDKSAADSGPAEIKTVHAQLLRYIQDNHGHVAECETLAAELVRDALRWRKARTILSVDAIQSANAAFVSFGRPHAESESVQADQAIDEAMEA